MESMPILFSISPNLSFEGFPILSTLVCLSWLLVNCLNAALKFIHYSDEQIYFGGTEVQFDLMTFFYLKSCNLPIPMHGCVLDVDLCLMTCMWTSDFSIVIEVIYLSGRKLLRASSDDIHYQNAIVCNSNDQVFGIIFH